MAIHIQRATSGDINLDKSQTLHYMPCKINTDGEANVSKFFQPYINKQDTDQVLNASYRGYPLLGQIVNFPKNYHGVVLQEKMKPLSDKEERNFFVTHNFKAITYWNWDKIPTRNDAFITALDWIDISEALHATVDEK